MRFRVRLVLLLLVTIFGMTSCYSYKYSGAMRPVPPAAGKEEIPLFAYQKTDSPYTFFGREEAHKGYAVKQFKLKVKDFNELDENCLKGYFYEHKDKSVKRPALVVLPPTGGPYEIVKYFATYFADRGFTVIALRRREAFFNPKETLDYNKKLIRQAVIDARRAVDFLDTLDYVDHDKVCLIGVSLGGITGTLAMEADPRFKAAGFHVTAGHLNDILMTSGFFRVGQFREAMMKELNANCDQLKACSAPILAPLDPVTYADRLDPARIVMINGAFDDIIRRDIVMETHKSYGGPDEYFIPAGHYTSIGFSGYGNKKIYEHFLKVLKVDPNSLK